MSQNTASAQQIPLETFGGLVTYINPTALPPGVSPNNVDCSFLPGGVGSRPCFKKVFAQPWGTDTVNYGKSYVDPQGVIRNLYLTSSGNFYVEVLFSPTSLVVANPGHYTMLFTTTPGSRCRSITAFGREYIAISDGLHGQEVPLQYDGTTVERVTQDGPGAPPSVVSLALPAVSMVAGSAPPTLAITGIFPNNPAFSPGGYYTTIQVFFTADPPTVPIGSQVTISGTGTQFDGGPYTVSAQPGDGSIELSFYSAHGTPSYTGAGTFTLTGSGGTTTMIRQNNIVTVYCAAPHNLLVGYQAQITEVPAAAIGGGITNITINNEDNSGIATVTTANPHGVVPGVFVSLNGITGTAVGGGIISIARAGGITTVTTSAAHGLNPGAEFTIAGATDATFNTSASVQSTPSPTTFTFLQLSAADATATGGTLTINWPIPDTPTPSYFEVLSAPTANSFQVQVFYSDGTWNGGTVSYAWDGIFYVKAVIDAMTFQYQQYGPNDSTTQVGTVTPYGQAAPGQHQMQVLFLTDQGAITAPSPPVTFQANGGQYISASNIPIGPPNVIARILAFTSAQGAYFFYIPATPQINGQIVGTSTQINDNTTTSVVLDFGDPTLLSATGISTQGNNLANQVVLDGALGFGYYGSRLISFGQRNRIQNLINMGFDGGYFPSTPTVPTGWTLNPASTGGSLTAGRFEGLAWQIAITPGGTFCGLITQSFYQDFLGDPIGTGNTLYKVRLYARSNIPIGDAGLTIAISSFDESFDALAQFTGINTVGGWYEATFSAKTPDLIAPDTLLSIYGTSTATVGVSIIVDEVSIIPVLSPYNLGMIASYVDNPEGFDGVTGVFGPVDDTHQVMDMSIIRNTLKFLTLDPAGRLHETSQGTTEPADWTVNEIASNCGAVSAFSLTRSQSDDETASGGEEWFAWMSSTGVRIYGGYNPDKISQEIQRPAGEAFPGAPPDLGAFNPAAGLTVWGLNDPDQKIMYFGIPTGVATAPDRIFTVSYLGMDSAESISAAAPVHRSLSGRMVANDLSRKWSPWNRTMNGAALMYRGATDIEPVFFSGNGGAGAAKGNVYTLSSTLYTDDDYGQIAPLYVTYGFPFRDQEEQYQLGSGLKMVKYLQAFNSGIGVITLALLYNSLDKVWPLTGVYTMQASALRNTEWGGGQATAQRFFVHLSFAPIAGQTDINFSLSVLSMALAKNARGSVAGAYP